MTPASPASRPYRLLALLLLAAPTLRSQQLPAAAANAAAAPGDMVAGRVLNSKDGRALPNAHVTLSAAETGHELASTNSADDGSFRFAAVPRGKWSLRGQAPGFVAAGYLEHDGFSSAIVTGAGLDTRSLQLTLTPLAGISGTVTDTAGDPVAQASVSLFREMPPGSREPIQRTRTTLTDGTGHFDFANVIPGTFYLSAHGRPWYAVNPPPPFTNPTEEYRTAVDPALQVAFPTVFYPHAHSAAEATPLLLHPGEEAVADMQLTPEPAVTLTVKLPTTDDGKPLPFFPELTQTLFGNRDPMPLGEVQFRDGNLYITGLPPGEYDLQLMGGGSGVPFGSTHVDLTGGSLATTATSDPTIACTLHLHAGAEPLTDLQVRLRQAASGPEIYGPVHPDGTAQFPAVPSGDYTVSVYKRGLSLPIRELTVHHQPAPDGKLHLSGSAPVDADVDLETHTVQLEGFTTHDGHPAVGAMIVLVPVEPNSTSGWFRRDQSDLDGGFTLRNVRPGKYVLVAIADGWSLRWNNSATLLRYLPKGLPVDVPETGPLTLQLPTPVPEEPR